MRFNLTSWSNGTRRQFVCVKPSISQYETHLLSGLAAYLNSKVVLFNYPFLCFNFIQRSKIKNKKTQNNTDKNQSKKSKDEKSVKGGRELK